MRDRTDPDTLSQPLFSVHLLSSATRHFFHLCHTLNAITLLATPTTNRQALPLHTHTHMFCSVWTSLYNYQPSVATFVGHFNGDFQLCDLCSVFCAELPFRRFPNRFFLLYSTFEKICRPFSGCFVLIASTGISPHWFLLLSLWRLDRMIKESLCSRMTYSQWYKQPHTCTHPWSPKMKLDLFNIELHK